MTTRSRVAALSAVLTLALAACGTGADETTDLERGEVVGLQLSGTVRSRLMAVSDGAPELLVGNCDRFVGLPAEVCVISNDIDGGRLVLGLGNPAAIAAAGTLEVTDASCRTAQACAEVTGGAVVWLIVGDEPVPVEGGSVTLTELVRGVRYTGSVGLDLGGGRLSGRFDVIPRPDED